MEFTMIEAGWLSILPPLIAIVLALITKEVYSSLFFGVFSGMLIYAFSTGGSIISATAMTFDMMYSKIADNAYMIIFLALLWAVVMLVSRSGGSLAYGNWAGKKITLKVKKISEFGEMVDAVRVSPERPTEEKIFCEACGQEILPVDGRSAETIANATRNKYGKKLCMTCARKEKTNG